MLYVVGLGSGSIENMTKEAFDATTPKQTEEWDYL